MPPDLPVQSCVTRPTTGVILRPPSIVCLGLLGPHLGQSGPTIIKPLSSMKCKVVRSVVILSFGGGDIYFSQDVTPGHAAGRLSLFWTVSFPPSPLSPQCKINKKNFILSTSQVLSNFFLKACRQKTGEWSTKRRLRMISTKVQSN